MVIFKKPVEDIIKEGTLNEMKMGSSGISFRALSADEQTEGTPECF